MNFEVTDLTVARGGIPLLAGLSFSLQAGQALILRGPNGSGKTTLLRTIAGLQPPVSGAITAGEDQITYAAHSDGLKATLNVTENLEFWAEVFGHSNIEPALAAFDLLDLRDRLAGTLSAGQKRRVGLARLLVTGRPIWVLDEPTVSLDTFSVRLFADVVRAHLEQGGIALIATHIDLGIDEAAVLDITPYAAKAEARVGASDELFL